MFKRCVVLFVAVVVSAVVVSAVPAFAVVGPAWRIGDIASPSSVPPGGGEMFVLVAENVGNVPTVAGAPVTVVDRLPQGMTATRAAALSQESFALEPAGVWGECAVTAEGHTVTCTYQGHAIPPVFSSPPTLRNNSSLAPEAIGIEVNVGQFASGTLTDNASVVGGGASGMASNSAGVRVGPLTEVFGVASFHQWSTNYDGSPATQAGSHQYETTTSVMFNTFRQNNAEPETEIASGTTRNIRVELPAGFVGNANAVPKCPRVDFDKVIGREFLPPICPSDTQVGVVTGSVLTANLPAETAVYNLVPPSGVPVQFGIALGGTATVFLDANVQPGRDGAYHVYAEAHNVQVRKDGLKGASIALWGDPADPSHDRLRYPSGHEGPVPSGVPSDAPLKPFLSLPSSCGVPQALGVSADSYEEPSVLVSPPSAFSTDEQNNPVSMAGCDKLDFSPTVEVAPETSAASTPSGVEVNVRMPQSEDPNGLAEADVKDATVALPAGLAVSPSAANGLAACSEEQIGVSDASNPIVFNEAPVACPAASKIGTIEIQTPLLEHPLVGGVYVAQQGNLPGNGSNPFGSLLAMYANVEGSGVLVKFAGEIVANPVTGQLTAKILNNPQVPFSDAKFKFFGGPQATFMTPSACGTYTLNTTLTGWNGSVASPSGSFPVNQGCGQGFGPAFTAGTASNQAGGFTPFSMTLSRGDSEQGLSGVQVTMPPGLLGYLKSVPRCPEPQASEGACGAESLVGETSVSAGPGPDPFWVTGGRVYLTGPYHGAPFGLSIAVPGTAGPFNIGPGGGPIVVRARVDVDRSTGQVTVTSDPLPTIEQGIPLDIRTVNVVVSRTGFLFNPTNCNALSVTGTATSTLGATSALTNRFQAVGCSKLPFKPVFSVATQARTGKKEGASLLVKAAFPVGPQANIHSVAVDLPKQLPARLTTIQQACPQATFDRNPAGCPAGSVIGTGTVRTPILTNAVSGPAFLVSHGGAAFPDLVLVLQGEGVTLMLTGSINIKGGITSSDFATVPDAPVSSFQLTLPEGPDSALAAVLPANAKGNMCGQGLAMPFTITGQNGAVIKQNVKIQVSGCPKPKKAVKKKKPRKR
jgi:hypothetical protein